MEQRFTIGELSRRTGVPVRTIRFHSDAGVLPPPARTAAGYRLYDARSLPRLEAAPLCVSSASTWPPSGGCSTAR